MACRFHTGPMANPKGGKMKKLKHIPEDFIFRNPDPIIPAMTERVGEVTLICDKDWGVEIFF